MLLMNEMARKAQLQQAKRMRDLSQGGVRVARADVEVKKEQTAELVPGQNPGADASQPAAAER